jgi:hydrogenase nickel incorporation protein HypB
MLDSVPLGIDLLAANDDMAERNRRRIEAAGARCVNIMSSPGSGKTTLLEATLSAFAGRPRVGVIEGDMTTELDADRLRARGAHVAAITTGRSCHLEAEQIAGGLDRLEVAAGGLEAFELVVIENVGNLICPAAYDLGEHARVVLVAVTEGEDKPLKYPIMFHGADCVVITKIDLAPYVRLNVDRLAANVRQVNAGAEVMALSAESGAGMEAWLGWLRGAWKTLPRH